MIRRIIFLFIVCVFVTSCGDECIQPGDGVSQNVIEVDVPVYMKGATINDKGSLWVDTGVNITSQETLPLSITGAINFCADTEENIQSCANPKICRKVVVPALHCSDGSQLSYYDDPIDESKMCAHSQGKLAVDGWYVDSGLKVNPGDTVKFDVIPYKTIKVTDCYNIPPEVENYTFEDLESLYLGVTNKSQLDSKEKKYIQDIIDNKLHVICENGLDLVKIPNAKNGAYLHLPPFKGRVFNVDISNNFIPEGNKVYTRRHKFNKNVYWYKGSLADARVSIHGKAVYDYDCKKGSPPDSNMLRLNTYDINLHCKSLCEEETWSGYCISSLRYKWVPGSDECKKYAKDSAALHQCRSHSTPQERWANGIIAKVGGNNRKPSDPGQQCLPTNALNTRCNVPDDNVYTNNSLKLNHEYSIEGGVKANSGILFGIINYSGSHNVNIGGYNLRVDRSCVRSGGDGLYMYIGSNPDSVVPGDVGTYSVTMKETKLKSGNTMYKPFMINGGTSKGFSPPANGRIYFGIKGAIESDTVKANFIDKKNSNKYTVHIYKTVWNPLFSNFFKLIRDTILDVLYGSVDEISKVDIHNTNGLISSAYNRIINNGLIAFTQAVLVLFIAFSAIAFMFGLVQATQAEIFIRIVKIGIVLAATSPGSWELFGVSLFNLFVRGVDTIAGVFSSVTGSDNAFAFLDPTLGVFLTRETWLRLCAIMLSGPIGFITFILLLWGVWCFMGAMISAVMSYLITIIGISLLFMLTPLFMITILFRVTRTLFEGWIKMMLSLSLTPVMMFAALAFLNQIMMAALFAINNFTICKACVFEMSFSVAGIPIVLCPATALLPSTYVSDSSFEDQLNAMYAHTNENVFGLPFNLVAVIVFFIAASSMKAFVGISENMAKDIAGTMTPDFSSPGGAGDSAVQGMLSLVGQDRDTQQMRKQALSMSNVDPTKVRAEKRKGIDGVKDRELRDVGEQDEKAEDGQEHVAGVRAGVSEGSETVRANASQPGDERVSGVASDSKDFASGNVNSNITTGSETVLPNVRGVNLGSGEFSANVKSGQSHSNAESVSNSSPGYEVVTQHVQDGSDDSGNRSEPPESKRSGVNDTDRTGGV